MKDINFVKQPGLTYIPGQSEMFLVHSEYDNGDVVQRICYDPVEHIFWMLDIRDWNDPRVYKGRAEFL